MSLPAKSDPRWSSLLLGKTSPEFTALATKLAVGRLRQTVRQNPATLAAALDEIHRYFEINVFAQRDLSRL
jgi:hypothetical protein